MLELLVQVVIVLLIVGMLLWCIQRIPGIPGIIIQVGQIIVVLAAAIWLMRHFGILKSLGLG